MRIDSLADVFHSAGPATQQDILDAIQLMIQQRGSVTLFGNVYCHVEPVKHVLLKREAKEVILQAAPEVMVA